MLVDRHGKTRGEFNVTREGVAQIAVFDGTGTLRAGLGVGIRRRPGPRHLRQRRQARAEVGLTNSVARLVLFDAERQPKASIGVAHDGKSVSA